MTFTAPLGLLALLAVPAVVALHLFRARLRERRVAAAFLFPGRAAAAGPGRVRSPLVRSPSLWCEVLAALLLAAWLGGLSFGGVATRPLVLVLDDSASMGADGTLDRARRAARDVLAARRGGAFVVVLRSGERPETLVDARERGAGVDEVLARWRPSSPRHDVRRTLAVARELAGDDGDVVLVTDETLPPGHDDVTWIACGTPAPNRTITTFERLPALPGARADTERVRVRAAAFGSGAPVTATVLVGDRAVASVALVFTDGVADAIAEVPAGSAELRVQLPRDALAIDDAAWSLLEPQRVVAVADTLPAGLREPLRLDAVFAAVNGWRAEADAARAQLVLASAPGTPRDGQLEVVLAAGDGEGRVERAPFLVDRAHPFMHGVHLDGVAWSAPPLALPGRPLVVAGTAALATEEPLAHGRRLWLALRAGAGNLVRAPDWPVLFANLLDACRDDAPGAVATHVVVGAEARFRRLPGDAGEPPPVLVDPDGARRAGSGDGVIGWVLAKPGVHVVLDAGGVERARFAASFRDVAESDLARTTTGRRDGAPPQAAVRAAPWRDATWERRVLALLVLLLLAIDWWLLADGGRAR